MATSSSIWVVIRCDEAVDKLRNLIDSGSFAEANSLLYQLKSITDKFAKLIESRGGSIAINTYDRIVLETALTVAQDIPNIIEGYLQFFGTKIAVGMGMTFSEASSAARKSMYSNEIELYDPKDPAFKEGSPFYKDEGIEYHLPPNLFDPLQPNRSGDVSPAVAPYIGMPSLQDQMQAEAEVIQAMVQQMGGQPPQPEEQQQDQDPRDLMEALHGEQIPGREQQLNENTGGEAESIPSGQEDESKSGKGKESKESDDGDEDEDESGSSEDHEKKLASLLSTVKQNIPQLMGLAESNPKAYQQTVTLIQKLLTVARNVKDTKKAEAEQVTEELNKALLAHLPLGSRKGNKRKVLIQGKAVWRSMAAGQLKDQAGQAISVKSHNAAAQKGTQREGK